MILKKVVIDNFRSFEKEKAILYDINVLVGKNNSGKSNFIQALDLFFNYKEKFQNKDLDQCLFKNNIQSSSKLRFIIECTFKVEKGENIKIRQIRQIRRDEERKAKKEIKVTNSAREVRIKFTHSRVPSSFYGNRKYKIYNFNTKKFIRLRGYNFREIFKKMSFIYIPAFRSLENTEIMNNIFTVLLSNISNVRRNKLLKSIQTVKEKINNNILKTFEHDFNSLIEKDFFGELKTSLKFSSSDYKFLQETLKNLILLVNDGIKTNADEKGSGLQSYIIIWLYNYLAKLSKKNLILALEEPEAHLHPSAQKNLMKGISQIFKSEKDQIIITTHSPFLINSSELLSTIYFRRAESAKPPKSSISQIDKAQLSSYNFSHLERNLGIEKKDIFFADKIILSEGPSDKLVFKHLFGLYDINLDFNNILVIDYC